MTIDISKVTTEGEHIGSYRSTKYELRFLHVGPNGVGAEVTERGVYGSSPIRCEVPESLYTPDQIATIKAALSLIEEGFRAVHDAKEAELELAGIAIPRAKVYELVRQAEEAKTQKATLEADVPTLAAQKATLEAEVAALEAQKATLEAQAVAVVDVQSTAGKVGG